MVNEMISQRALAELLGIDPKTVYRWRTEGRTIDGELIYLKAINTAGLGTRGGRIMVPLNHAEMSHGFRYLGAANFVAALGFDPSLRSLEQELLA